MGESEYQSVWYSESSGQREGKNLRFTVNFPCGFGWPRFQIFCFLGLGAGREVAMRHLVFFHHIESQVVTLAAELIFFFLSISLECYPVKRTVISVEEFFPSLHEILG